MEDYKKNVKGKIWFFLRNGYVENYIKEYTEEEIKYKNMYQTEFNIYDLMAGEEFANTVECGSFIDYDGTLSSIFVDDYESNLGIWNHGIHQGKFYLGLYDFRKLCKEHKIEVNWANK